jgi:hypothetical protein
MSTVNWELVRGEDEINFYIQLDRWVHKRSRFFDRIRKRNAGLNEAPQERICVISPNQDDDNREISIHVAK